MYSKKQYSLVSINIISIIIIISVHHLFCKGPRPLVTVSTTDIPVLHSTEVVHFHCESWFTLLPEVANLLTHFQGRSSGFTMKSFKGSSNKLWPLDFTRQTDVEPPSKWHNNTQPIHMRIEATLYLIRQAILTLKRNTTNNLEKVLILD
jgi:hypothetical protein